MYSKTVTGKSTKSSLAELRSVLDQAEAVFVGAGGGAVRLGGVRLQRATVSPVFLRF